jgi:hypothetical protein
VQREKAATAAAAPAKKQQPQQGQTAEPVANRTRDNSEQVRITPEQAARYEGTHKHWTKFQKYVFEETCWAIGQTAAAAKCVKGEVTLYVKKDKSKSARPDIVVSKHPQSAHHSAVIDAKHYGVKLVTVETCAKLRRDALLFNVDCAILAISSESKLHPDAQTYCDEFCIYIVVEDNQEHGMGKDIRDVLFQGSDALPPLELDDNDDSDDDDDDDPFKKFDTTIQAVEREMRAFQKKRRDDKEAEAERVRQEREKQMREEREERQRQKQREKEELERRRQAEKEEKERQRQQEKEERQRQRQQAERERREREAAERAERERERREAAEAAAAEHRRIRQQEAQEQQQQQQQAPAGNEPNAGDTRVVNGVTERWVAPTMRNDKTVKGYWRKAGKK